MQNLVFNEIGMLPLTGAQRNIWFHQQIDTASAAYNLSFRTRISGDLSPERLARSVQYVVDRLDSLRVRYLVENEEPISPLRN